MGKLSQTLFLFFVCFFLSANNQYLFKNYNSSLGLSNEMTTSCIQDHHGHIWIGTRDGLNRFDGYSFKVFRNEINNPKSIGGDYITSLAIDNNNTLWIATSKGLYIYDESFEHFDLIPFTEKKYVQRIFIDQQASVWMIIDREIWQYNPQDKTHQSFAHPTQGTFTSICTQNNQLWAADADGVLHLLFPESQTLNSFQIFPSSPDHTIKRINLIYPSAYSSMIYIGTQVSGLLVFDTNTHQSYALEGLKNHLPDLSVRSILEVNPNQLYIGTTTCLILYNTIDHTYFNIKRDPLDRFSLSGQVVNSIYKDKESGIWIGCYPGGLSYYYPNRLFSVYYEKNIPGALKGEVIHDICSDVYGNIWLGMEDTGLNIFYPEKNWFENIPSGTNNGPSQSIIGGLAASGDTLWIGTLHKGIDRMDIPSKKIIRNYTLNHRFSEHISSEIVCMKITGNNELLVGTDRGIYKYDYDSDSFLFMDKIPLKEYRIQCISEDKAGTLWIGLVNGGIYRYSPADGKGEFMPYDPLNIYSSKTINDIYHESPSIMWLASMDGLQKYNKKTYETVRYRTEDGLPTNVLFRILSDEEDNLWISTAKGLVYYNQTLDKFNTYTESNGLISSQFIYNSSHDDNKGSFYFGTSKGLIRFDPESVKNYQNDLSVRLTSVLSMTESESNYINLLNQETKQVEFEHSNSNFSVNFSTFSYIAPESIEYSYRLNNGSWSSPIEKSSITFTRLSPGKYDLEIRARYRYSNWESASTLLNIVIRPPWWNSIAAYYVYIFIFFSLILIFCIFMVKQSEIRIKRNTLLLETEKERELYHAKVEFFTNIAHEIRTPLTLIKTPLDKILKKEEVSLRIRESLELMEKNTSRLLSLVNQLLDFRKAEQENYHLNFVRVDIASLLYRYVNDFKEETEKAGLLLNIDIPVKELNVFVDKEAIIKIISNLMTNAIKYTDHIITVRLSVSENYDQFTIDFINDGKPISMDLREKVFEPFFRERESNISGSGLGLPLARSLADMHHGSLTVADTYPDMTTFRLVLPVNQKKAILLPKDDKNLTNHSANVPYIQRKSAPTILVVEDNKEMLHFIGHELNETYNILTAENGAEALILLQKESVHLIITDIMMPEVDGLELLQRVKSDMAYSHIPVILLTAKTTIQSKLKGLDSKADAYIEKPFDMDLLLAQISNLLSNRENIRDFYFHSPIANIKSTAHSKSEEEFLEKLNDVILQNLSDTNLDVNMLAEAMNMSRSVLYRKIKTMSNRTPNDLIKITRLKKAAELLKTKNLKIYEIAEMVGFSTQSYFYYAFLKEFNMSPSEYAKNENGVKASGKSDIKTK